MDPDRGGELGPFRCAEEIEAYREDVERRARRAGACRPMRWPEPFPPDSERAMLAATYAKQIGRGGRLLASPRSGRRSRPAATSASATTVLIAAAACEMHPAAVIKGAELRGTRARARGCRRRRPRRPACATVPALVTAGTCRRHRAVPVDEGQPRRRAARAPRRPRPPARRPTRSTTSRSWRSTPARSCCSGTPRLRRPAGSRAR